MNRRRKITLVFVAILLGISVYWYDSIGGFAEGTVEVKEVEAKLVHGKYWVGNEEAMGKEMENLKNKIRSSEKKVRPILIFDKNARQGDHNVKIFFGAIIEDSSVSVSSDFEYRFLPSRKVLYGTIFGKEFASINLHKEMLEYAEDNDLVLTHDGNIQYASSIDEEKMDYFIEMPVKD